MHPKGARRNRKGMQSGVVRACGWAQRGRRARRCDLVAGLGAMPTCARMLRGRGAGCHEGARTGAIKARGRAPRGRTDRRCEGTSNRAPRGHTDGGREFGGSQCSDGDVIWARGGGGDGAFSCIVKTQQRRSNKIYKTKLTKIRYKIK